MHSLITPIPPCNSSLLLASCVLKLHSIRVQSGAASRLFLVPTRPEEQRCIRFRVRSPSCPRECFQAVRQPLPSLRFRFHRVIDIDPSATLRSLSLNNRERSRISLVTARRNHPFAISFPNVSRGLAVDSLALRVVGNESETKAEDLGVRE